MTAQSLPAMTDLADQLSLWPITAPGRLTPVPHSENRVYRVTDAGGKRYILRLHRPGYHDRAAIESELDWIAALASDTDVLVPEVISAISGTRIAELQLRGEKAPQLAVLFKENTGELPDESDVRLNEIFEALGAASARCHMHVATWHKPQGFKRPDWTIATTLGRDGIWGDWRAAPGLSAHDTDTLATTEEQLLADFAGYGHAPDRFGLIHNDMRPSNFLWHAGTLRLIDFDDCGFSWFIADFAASVSWFEDDPRVPELFRHWRNGYETHRTLSTSDIAMAGPAVMARRMLLLAWIASRSETDLAAAQAAGFVAGTVQLARRYLRGEPLV